MSTFWHLHAHSTFSKGDALPDPYDLRLRAAEFDQPALALTDHGTMAGLLNHQMGNDLLSKRDHRKLIIPKRDVVPVHGCEWYVVDDAKDPTRSRNHLVTVAKDWEGYKAMVKMSRYGLEHHHYRPIIDRNLLKEMSDAGLTKHLIATTACPLSHVAMAMVWEGADKAYEELEWYKSVFPNFYVEIMDHGMTAEDFGEGGMNDTDRNKLLIDLARSTDTPLVITNDVHYVDPKDYYYHHALLCCATGKNMMQRAGYSGGGYHLKSEEEMYELFKHYGDDVWDESQQSLTNILEQCNDFSSPTFFNGTDIKWHLPTVSGGNPDKELLDLVQQGLYDRVKHRVDADLYEKYKDQAKYELGIFMRSGFSTYFLMLHDWIKWCKQEAPCSICRERGEGDFSKANHNDKDHPYFGILVGPCRGSAGGSLVLYLLHTTDIDPIRYGLSFDRFIDEERLKYDVPDVDIDVQDDRRYEIIEYLTKRYGEKNVVQIGTIMARKAASACKDACLALGIPMHETKTLVKWIHDNSHPTIWAMDVVVKLFDREDTNEKVEEIMDKYPDLEMMVKKLCMSIKGHGKHAAGVVIADDGVLESMDPMIMAGDGIVSAYPYHYHPFVGLVKNDILGLTNLRIIQEARKLVWDRKQVDIWEKLEEINDKDLFNDKKVYDLICKGDTQGVFQFEGGSFPTICKNIAPNKFSDLADINALVRPGPGRFLNDYIEAKRKGGIKHDDKRLDPILDPTYGILLYEDQVLRIGKEIAGISAKCLYVLKKAVKYSSIEMMLEVKDEIVDGLKNAGFSEENSEKWFKKITALAGYGFNSSHCYGYSMIGYYTAWIMVNYPIEYCAALLTTTGEVKRYKPILDRYGIKVLPPDINESQAKYTAIGDDTIRYGLCDISGVSLKGYALIRERVNEKPFTSEEDFHEWYAKMPKRNLNNTAIKNMKLVGAMDSIGVEVDYEELGAHKKPDKVIADRAEAELKLMGVYVTHDPIGKDQIIIDKVIMSEKNLDKLNGDEVTEQAFIGGLVLRVKEHKQKNGQMMAFVDVGVDSDHQWNSVIFASIYNQDYVQNALKSNKVILMQGKWDPAKQSMVVMKITTPNRLREKLQEKKKLQEIEM